MKTNTATKALTPNQIVALAAKKLKKLATDSKGIADNYDYEEQKSILSWLEKEARVGGFVSVLGKKQIIQLVNVQSSTRFMAEHRFYMLFNNDID
jgi:hypothetical protein